MGVCSHSITTGCQGPVDCPTAAAAHAGCLSAAVNRFCRCACCQSCHCAFARHPLVLLNVRLLNFKTPCCFCCCNRYSFCLVNTALVTAAQERHAVATAAAGPVLLWGGPVLLQRKQRFMKAASCLTTQQLERLSAAAKHPASCQLPWVSLLAHLALLNHVPTNTHPLAFRPLLEHPWGMDTNPDKQHPQEHRKPRMRGCYTLCMLEINPPVAAAAAAPV